MSSSFEHTIELLQLLVDNGAKQCTNSRMLEEIVEAELGNFLLDPQFMLNQKYKNLNAPEAQEPKIPYILHHIWLTHPESAREIRNIDIANVIATKDIFRKVPVDDYIESKEICGRKDHFIGYDSPYRRTWINP